jgi:hypothetical protein
MANHSLTVLALSARQAFEVARLLDRHGDGILAAEDGIVTLLIDVYGVGRPSLALELDGDGEVIARQALTLHAQDDDGLDDFSDEEPLPYPVDLRHARPALRCTCPSPRVDGDTCGRCGHLLPEPVAEAA